MTRTAHDEFTEASAPLPNSSTAYAASSAVASYGRPASSHRRGICVAVRTSVPLDEAQVIHGPFSRDGGYEAMSAVLAAGEPRPDCVFAVTDVMALGALARLRAGGLQVPADIALAGFDDIATLRDMHPPLTTVRLPLKRMGEMAASLIPSQPGDAAPNHPRVIPVPGEVILRDSTIPRPPA
jgi:LacI family transcriptional regulator